MPGMCFQCREKEVTGNVSISICNNRECGNYLNNSFLSVKERTFIVNKHLREFKETK